MVPTEAPLSGTVDWRSLLLDSGVLAFVLAVRCVTGVVQEIAFFLA
jgi:hypothetical protein